jgi:hypothetical protein
MNHNITDLGIPAESELHGIGISFKLYAHDNYIQKFGMPKDTCDFGGHHFVLPPSFGGHLSVRQWVKNIVRPDMIVLSSQRVMTESGVWAI